MRRHKTHSEERLWAELRGRRLGVAFRRQVIIGRYVADFASSAARPSEKANRTKQNGASE